MRLENYPFSSLWEYGTSPGRSVELFCHQSFKASGSLAKDGLKGIFGSSMGLSMRLKNLRKLGLMGMF
jgi:hypothetical protein